jgi:hypothetical protein
MRWAMAQEAIDDARVPRLPERDPVQSASIEARYQSAMKAADSKVLSCATT